MAPFRFSEEKALNPARNAINALSRANSQIPETPWLSIVRVDRHVRICSLFTNDDHFPKLDVTGSIPVSRSIFSIVYVDIAPSNLRLNGVKRSNRLYL